MTQEWDLSSLNLRRGGPRRLLGLKIYHDFVWAEIFPDNRSQFRNGLSLARLAKRAAPDGKEPALLLTLDDATDRTPIETEGEYILVVPIREYLKLDHADAAATYFANTIGPGLASLSRYSELAETPDLLALFLDEHLTTDLITKWASADMDRVAELGQAFRGAGDSKPEPTFEGLVESIGRLTDIEWAALIEALTQILDAGQFEGLVAAATDHRSGRRATLSALGSRLSERIDDLEHAAEEYNNLVSSAATETQLHSYLQRTPWLLGLDYVKVRSKVLIPRGELDFVLDRFDGYFDVLELKGPGDPIVVAPDAVDGVPPPASTYRLSPALGSALAQIHFYRESLQGDQQHLSDFYGLDYARTPRFIIVIGREEGLLAHQRTVLAQLNQTLHRVEILPYDLVGKRAQTWIGKLREILHLTDQETEASQVDLPI